MSLNKICYLVMVLMLPFGVSVYAKDLSVKENQNDRDGQKTQIHQLASEIQRHIYYSDLSTSQLSQMKSLLSEARRIMWEGRDGDVFERCFDFSLPIFSRFFSSSRAFEKTQQTCRNVQDYEVFKYVYDIKDFYLSSLQALERASSSADEQLIGKIELVKFSYDKYSKVLSGLQAIRRSIEGVRPLSQFRTLECFQRAYPVYRRNFSASQAMDRTISSCR